MCSGSDFERARVALHAGAPVAQAAQLAADGIAAGLQDPGAGAASAEERMSGAMQLAKLRMERRLAFLGTLGANAPFIVVDERLCMKIEPNEAHGFSWLRSRILVTRPPASSRFGSPTPACTPGRGSRST